MKFLSYRGGDLEKQRLLYLKILWRFGEIHWHEVADQFSMGRNVQVQLLNWSLNLHYVFSLSSSLGDQKFAKDVPMCALEDDRIVEIQGESSAVHKAIELIASHLRKFLVDRSVIGLFEMQMQNAPPQMDHNMPPPQMEYGSSFAVEENTPVVLLRPCIYSLEVAALQHTMFIMMLGLALFGVELSGTICKPNKIGFIWSRTRWLYNSPSYHTWSDKGLLAWI